VRVRVRVRVLVRVGVLQHLVGDVLDDDARGLQDGEEAEVVLGEHVAHVRLGPRVLGHLLDPQVHHEREVVPQVVLVADVVLEAHLLG